MTPAQHQAKHWSRGQWQRALYLAGACSAPEWGASSTSSLPFTSSLHNRRGWEALEEKKQLFLFLL